MPAPSQSVPAFIKVSALVLWCAPLLALTTADPDLWGHLVFGRDIAGAWSVHAADSYSFTSDRPWINHEWLAEVLMYLAYKAGGPAGLVYLKTFIMFLVLACIIGAWRLRRLRVRDEALLIALALFAMYPRYMTVRPQVFSLLCFALELLVLAAGDRGRRTLLWMPLIFVFWANTHGGFIVGLGVLAIWTAGTALRDPKGALRPLALLVASVAATLANPYGIRLWRFLWETVGTSRPEIEDWTPALSSVPLLVAWVLLVLTAGVAVWKARKTGIRTFAVVIVVTLALATLRVGRLDAFLALSVVMLLGPAFGDGQQKERRIGQRGLIPAAVVLGSVVVGIALTGRSSCLTMSTWPYPEPEAAVFLQGRTGRLLTPFNWGEYAIWHLAPFLKVSMDGRRETVYSEALFDAHQRLVRGEPGSTSLVRALAPDLVWLPVWSPAIATLEGEGWQAAFRGPVSVVLDRRVEGGPMIVEKASSGPRCFPQR